MGSTNMNTSLPSPGLEDPLKLPNNAGCFAQLWFRSSASSRSKAMLAALGDGNRITRVLLAAFAQKHAR